MLYLLLFLGLRWVWQPWGDAKGSRDPGLVLTGSILVQMHVCVTGGWMGSGVSFQVSWAWAKGAVRGKQWGEWERKASVDGFLQSQASKSRLAIEFSKERGKGPQFKGIVSMFT